MAVRATQTRRGPRRAGGGAVLCLSLALAACAPPPPDAEPDAGPKTQPAPRGRLVGPPVVVEAGMLRIRARTVRLWGIEAPARDAECLDPPGVRWPCGEHAAAALGEWIGTRSVNCDPRGDATDPFIAKCRLNGRDLGKWLVMHGWARDDPARSGGLYRTLQQAAEARQRGMWGEAPAATGTAPP